MADARRYRYIGPDEFRAARTGGVSIHTEADLARWLAKCDERDRAEPFTFVVTEDGVLRVAPRRSEHVACAEGGEVRAAGEISFARTPAGWSVRTVSNQSTGYCPDPDSWPAVSAALNRAAIAAPDGYTDPIVFRRCESCGERNVVRDDDFTCAICDAPLPAHWNF